MEHSSEFLKAFASFWQVLLIFDGIGVKTLKELSIASVYLCLLCVHCCTSIYRSEKFNG